MKFKTLQTLLLKVLLHQLNVETLIFFRGFKQDCPDGQLSKDKILEMYSMILPAGNAKVFVDQIFRIFDKDGNGSIDFKVSGLISTYLKHCVRLWFIEQPIETQSLLGLKARTAHYEKLVIK